MLSSFIGLLVIICHNSQGAFEGSFVEWMIDFNTLIAVKMFQMNVEDLEEAIDEICSEGKGFGKELALFFVPGLLLQLLGHAAMLACYFATWAEHDKQAKLHTRAQEPSKVAVA